MHSSVSPSSAESPALERDGHSLRAVRFHQRTNPSAVPPLASAGTPSPLDSACTENPEIGAPAGWPPSSHPPSVEQASRSGRFVIGLAAAALGEAAREETSSPSALTIWASTAMAPGLGAGWPRGVRSAAPAIRKPRRPAQSETEPAFPHSATAGRSGPSPARYSAGALDRVVLESVASAASGRRNQRVEQNDEAASRERRRGRNGRHAIACENLDVRQRSARQGGADTD